MENRLMDGEQADGWRTGRWMENRVMDGNRLMDGEQGDGREQPEGWRKG